MKSLIVVVRVVVGVDFELVFFGGGRGGTTCLGFDILVGCCALDRLHRRRGCPGVVLVFPPPPSRRLYTPRLQTSRTWDTHLFLFSMSLSISPAPGRSTRKGGGGLGFRAAAAAVCTKAPASFIRTVYEFLHAFGAWDNRNPDLFQFTLNLLR